MASGLDFYSISRQVSSLNSKSSELYALKRALNTYANELSGSWRGEDATEYLKAIELLCKKIDRAIEVCSSAAQAANNAVVYSREVDATKIADEGLDAAAAQHGGGGGSTGGW